MPKSQLKNTNQSPDQDACCSSSSTPSSSNQIGNNVTVAQSTTSETDRLPPQLTSAMPADIQQILNFVPKVVGSDRMKRFLADESFKDVTWESGEHSTVLQKKQEVLEAYLKETDDLMVLHNLEMNILNERSKILDRMIAEWEEALKEAQLREAREGKNSE